MSIFFLSRRKQCSGGFPLKIELKPDDETATRELQIDFNPAFVKQMLKKVDWQALSSAAISIQYPAPDHCGIENDEDPEFLAYVHKILLEIDVLQANLICPTCDRVYPVVDGIPNLLLAQDEI